MKSFFTVFLIGILMITTTSEKLLAQVNQIPNNGFENWDAGLAYDNPTDWDSPNESLMGIPGNSTYVVFEETDSVYSGNAAVMLESKDILVLTSIVSVPGFITLGDFTFNMITQEFDISGGTPFTGTPDKLQGFYNYAPVSSDNCLIEVLLLNYDVVNNIILDTIGVGLFTGNSATSGWEPFEAVITYNSTVMPNYMNINILSSDPNNIQAGSKLYVDELSFFTASTAGSDILSFDIPLQTGPSAIDGNAYTVDVVMPAGTDITNLIPTITISTGATITPASGVAQNFTAPLTYTVTSSGGTTQAWLVTVTVAAEPELFISEYIEGSSNNKAMEIYNPKSTAVNLDDYIIGQAVDGGGWQYYHSFPSGAVLNSNEVWVIITDQVDANLFAASNADEVLGYPSVVHFNGNDARSLSKLDGNDTIIVDIFGEPNNDPGTGWEVAGVANGTSEHTLQRKATVTTGNLDWAASFGTSASNSEWIVSAQDDFSDLGFFNFGGNIPPVISGTILTPALVTPTDTVVVSASISDPDGTISQVTLTWGLDGINFLNTLALSSVLGVYSSYPNSIPAHALGTEVFYKFEAIDDDNDTTVLVQSYIVENAPTNISIYDIQGQTAISPYEGQTVMTTGIVTGLLPGSYPAYYIQDGTGAWNGLYVFDSNTPTIGDEITITGEIIEYYDLTEMKNLTSYTVNSSGNALPEPVLLTTGALSDEAYETVFIRVENATCTNDDAGYGNWEIDDGSGPILVHNNDSYTYAQALGENYNVQGVLNFYYNWRIELRINGDVTIYSDIDPVNNTAFRMYPNPVTSTLNITGNQNISKISIFNILGEQMLQNQPEKNIVNIDVDGLTSGVYFLKVENENGTTSTKKFIKE
ncbi:MAG: T9SS type A sorting domain-containing protein [Bacteroidota bacterium]|nr:T9SS type A sorting domain-containing protein [Bacteroidota bacterium]